MMKQATLSCLLLINSAVVHIYPCVCPDSTLFHYLSETAESIPDLLPGKFQVIDYSIFYNNPSIKRIGNLHVQY